jgi:S-adenosylmethionine:tRNA ribosyltransferase-isomerase
MTKLSDFDFNLPEDLIAHHPTPKRDESRLLVIGNKLEDKHFYNLPDLLMPNDLLVFNNSKVIPARLFAFKDERKFEILLHKKIRPNIWHAFAKPGKKLKVDDILDLAEGYIKILQKLPTGEVEIEISDEAIITKHGHMPLPPYIKREDALADKTRYQTVYAAYDGSVAAPTAGLHFTEELLAKIPNKAFVTLHVGAGTFQPVKAENIEEHKMHSEWYEISPETEAAIKSCKGRVIAVGTTSARVLEASGGKAGSGDTEIFIRPGYKFKVVNALITNFHLPKSSLFMLVSALAGLDKMQAAYKHAIENKYRFFSYGDACFIGSQKLEVRSKKLPKPNF